MRKLLLILAVICLSGCTAMMVGGANSGGYEPPKDECTGMEKNDDCNSE